MRYLMLVTVQPDVPKPPPGPSQTQDIEVWVEETTGNGTRELGSELQPASASTSVRRRNGKVLVTEGPFAETAEQIAGFDILNCADLNEAIRIAAAHPVAEVGTLELRPFREDTTP